MPNARRDPAPPPRHRRGAWRRVSGVAVWATLALAAGLGAQGGAPVPAADRVPVGLTPERPLGELLLRHWSSDDALPTRSLLNVHRSRRGYLWIASFAGLVRFNGARFQLFDKEAIAALAAPGAPVELVSSGFYEIAEDEEGTLYLGTQGSGLITWRDGRFRPFGELEGIVRALLIDRSGHPWVGLADAGAWRWNGSKFVPVEHPSLDGATVRAFLEEDGTVYVATEGRGLVRLDGGAGGEATVLTSADGLVSDAVTSLCRTRGETLWIGTHGGLNRLEGERVTTVPELAGVEVYRLYEDGYGNLWAATEQGLFRRNALSAGFEHLVEHRGLSVRGVTAVGFDREGSAWLATYSEGLYQLRAGKLTSLTAWEGLASERVNVLYETPQGEILAGSDDGTVQVVRPRAGVPPVTGAPTVSTLELPFELPEVRVRGLYQDRGGDLWIASYAGLVRLSAGGAVRWWTTDGGFPSNQVRFVRPGRRAASLWVGTRNAGLVRLQDGEVAEVVDTSRGLVSNLVFDVDEDRTGNVLIATQGGLSALRADGTVRSYTRSEGLPGDIVFSVRVDSKGVVWAATNGGLARLVGERVDAVTAADGLGAESIFDVVDDGRGDLWLSSGVGVLRVARRELVEILDGQRQKLHPEVLDESDGMPHRECTGGTRILVANDGRLWIATLGGIAIVDPDRASQNRVSPSVVVERFRVDDLAMDLFGGEAIELPAGRKRFVFELAALSLVVPSAVRIRYRLDGFDDDWIEAGPERRALYTSLPTGAYTFRAIAANDDGVWNEDGARVAFRVGTRWHETLAFYATVALFGLAFFGAFYAWRIGAIRQRDDRLEAALAEDALRESEERYRILFSEANDAILIMDDVRIVDCNARACRMYGYTREELLSMTVEALAPELSSGSEENVFPAPVTQSTVRSLQFQQKRKDGTFFDAEISLGTFRLSGKVLIMAILRNVSERLRIEAERKKLITELEAKNDEMERFAYTISHDLKAPLFTVKGFLGFLKQDVEARDVERAARDIEQIYAAVENMGHLLEDLLELSRVGQAIKDPEQVPLTELAEEVVEHLAGGITSQGVTVEIASDLPAVYGDRQRLQQVLQNLIENAVKFSSTVQEPRVEVGSRRDGTATIVFVRDNGIGIEPRYHDRVFELFSRLDVDREGTGIGLATVKRIIEAHGGSIWIESMGQGSGATFCFTLPSPASITPLRP